MLRVVDALLDALLHGLDGLVEREPLCEVLLGRPADLAVDDTVGREVFDEVTGDPDETLGRLHHGDGHVERLQVLDERTAVGLLGEPLAQRSRRRRKLDTDRSASSMIVCGRRPPSRWSWREILGRSRIGTSAVGSV